MGNKTMRGARLLLPIALVLALAVPASALTWVPYVGPIKMNLVNYDEGTLYGVADGTYPNPANPTMDGLPQVAPTGGVINGHQSDTWGILRVSNIIADDGTDQILWQPSSSSELTLIFWGLTDTYLNQSTDGAGVITQNIHGTGIQIAIFEDTTPDYPGNTLGPGAWDNTTGPVDGGGKRGPVYPQVTDGTLVWTMRSRTGYDFNSPADDFIATFTSGSVVYGSVGHFLADLASVDGWGTGLLNNSSFIRDTIPAYQADGSDALGSPTDTADFLFGFTGTGNGSGSWLLKTTDPIETSGFIPEPISMAGMLLGIASVGGYVRRRKRSK